VVEEGEEEREGKDARSAWRSSEEGSPCAAELHRSGYEEVEETHATSLVPASETRER